MFLVEDILTYVRMCNVAAVIYDCRKFSSIYMSILVCYMAINIILFNFTLLSIYIGLDFVIFLKFTERFCF